MLAGTSRFVLAAMLLAPCISWAAPVKGTVTLPGEIKSGRRFMGYWRVDNGIVPIAPSTTKLETVAVIVGGKARPPAPKTVSVEIAGLQASPSLIVIGEGSVVEFRNNDKVAHDLSVASHPQVMPLERLPAGGLRRQRFAEAGGYLVRCIEYPHVTVSVVVVASPHFSNVDDSGNFKIADVPEGKAKLRIWSQGRWVHDQEIEVAARGNDFAVKVAGSGARDQTD